MRISGIIRVEVRLVPAGAGEWGRTVIRFEMTGARVGPTGQTGTKEGQDGRSRAPYWRVGA